MALSATQTFGQSRDSSYDALVSLFTEWRAFERPPLRDGVPDYTAATFARRHAELPKLAGAARRDQAGCVADRTAGRLAVLRAEMNGFDFYVRVLQPWVRDPA